MASVLAGLDVFVLSSVSEGMPMVLAEAMAASLPIVATAVGGVAEMVEEGVTGWLVPAGDEAAMRRGSSCCGGTRSARGASGSRGGFGRDRHSPWSG